MVTAASVASNDGGKAATKLDEALGGAARKGRARPTAPAPQTSQTFGEAAAKAVNAETAAILAEFD